MKKKSLIVLCLLLLNQPLTASETHVSTQFNNLLQIQTATVHTGDPLSDKEQLCLLAAISFFDFSHIHNITKQVSNKLFDIYTAGNYSPPPPLPDLMEAANAVYPTREILGYNLFHLVSDSMFQHGGDLFWRSLVDSVFAKAVEIIETQRIAEPLDPKYVFELIIHLVLEEFLNNPKTMEYFKLAYHVFRDELPGTIDPTTTLNTLAKQAWIKFPQNSYLAAIKTAVWNPDI